MLIRPENPPSAKIIVVGVGGAGCNAINTMISMEIQNVTFVAMNTDKQALDANLAPIKILIGKETTKGLGGGGKFEIGKLAAEEDIEAIHEVLTGADMVFVVAGMGGATGTGAGPVVAGIAKGLGALTVGVVYQPFLFEGKRRADNAKHGLAEIKDKVDTLITIPNQKILETIDRKVSFIDAMKKGDAVLGQAIKSISDIITLPGFINVDFADVKSVMKDAGSAVMGMGISSGDDRATVATRDAVSSPLLDLSIGGAKNALISITGNRELTLDEASIAMDIIQQYLAEDANIIVGVAIDDNMDKDIKVTVLATGFEDKSVERAQMMGVSMPNIRQQQQTQMNHVERNQMSHMQQSNHTQQQMVPQQTQPLQQMPQQDLSNMKMPQQDDDVDYAQPINFKKKPQFPDASRSGDMNSDEDITQIPAFLRRHGFGKK